MVTSVAQQLQRASFRSSALIANGTALSGLIDMRAWVSGDLYIPAAWTNANIGFYVCDTWNGTFLPLYDDNGNLVQITIGAVVSRSFSFPPEVFACRFVQLWSQLAGVSANQGGDRTILYELKS